MMLKAAAEQPGSHVVHSLYALALVNAEGGHYQEASDAVARAAVEAQLQRTISSMSESSSYCVLQVSLALSRKGLCSVCWTTRLQQQHVGTACLPSKCFPPFSTCAWLCLLCVCAQAVQQAQQALQAAESSEQQEQQHGSSVAPMIALIALLLSAR
jgi:hypothetical protein